ncbi:hypothetical protein DER44DRAFT_788487 [Fusarium oxysporum]|nr:hypothetical protein DER44DRAFT_788487 [Fusarium oxysporum]
MVSSRVSAHMCRQLPYDLVHDLRHFLIGLSRAPSNQCKLVEIWIGIVIGLLSLWLSQAYGSLLISYCIMIDLLLGMWFWRNQNLRPTLVDEMQHWCRRGSQGIYILHQHVGPWSILHQSQQVAVGLIVSTRG